MNYPKDKIDLAFYTVMTVILFAFLFWIFFYAPCWLFTLGGMPGRCISYFIQK